MILVTNDDSSKLLEPSIQPFDFPSSLVASKFASILSRRLHSISFVRRNEVNPFSFELFVQGVAVVGPVSHKASW